jgi:hypothetical protein
MATQTEVLRQILQAQQHITQQMNRGPPHGANHEGPNQVTTYAQFIGMKPPTFFKAEDPLEVLTPKIGTRKGLTCGSSLIKKRHSAGNSFRGIR